MKILLPTFLFIFFNSILFVESQSPTADIRSIEKQQEWIQTIISEQRNPIKSNNYLFYCTGHHGIIWSLISSDSSGIYVYNGTTRRHIEYSDNGLSDSLSFIRNNIKTITWGFDSLTDVAKLIKPLNNEVYNPIYNQLYLIKDNELVFSYNDIKNYYSASDSVEFHHNASRLVYLMLWLAAPSGRPYMPMPSDTL